MGRAEVFIHEAEIHYENRFRNLSVAKRIGGGCVQVGEPVWIPGRPEGLPHTATIKPRFGLPRLEGAML